MRRLATTTRIAALGLAALVGTSIGLASPAKGLLAEKAKSFQGSSANLAAPTDTRVVAALKPLPGLSLKSSSLASPPPASLVRAFGAASVPGKADALKSPAAFAKGSQLGSSGKVDIGILRSLGGKSLRNRAK